MHKWTGVMAISLNYCTPLHLSLKYCNRFNRQKQENDKIKFWKSVPSYVSVRQYQWRTKIIFIPSNKWENLKNVLFYTQQTAYTLRISISNFDQRPRITLEQNTHHKKIFFSDRYCFVGPGLNFISCSRKLMFPEFRQQLLFMYPKIAFCPTEKKNVWCSF